MEQLFCRFGTPLSILSDQGKEVDGRILREVCRLFGIDKRWTTPYKPSTNQVERLHRTINAVLGKTVAENQKDWDIRLPYVMAAYRATRHESTGYSPNFLTMCRETYTLRQLRSIRRCVATSVFQSLVSALVLSRLDYCNSLLIDLPSTLLQRLQSVQNAASRLIYNLRRCDHIRKR